MAQRQPFDLPAVITRDGKPITGGIDINTTDCRFAGTIYPKAGRAIVPTAGEIHHAPVSGHPHPPT